MSQFLVRPEERTGNHFRVAGEGARHLVRVLRAQVGDHVTVFDGQGGQSRARLTVVDPSVPSVGGEILGEVSRSLPRFRFRLFQGVPKGPKIDFVIEKAVELGVAEIIPFLSAKSPIKLGSEAGQAKQARWSRLAETAAKQCERPDLVSVAAPISFEELIGTVGSAPAFLLSTSPTAPALAAWVSSARERGSFFDGDSVIIGIVVGPESGFSKSEEEALVRAGAQPVSLGRNVLRTETAGLAALAILDFELNQIDPNT